MRIENQPPQSVKVIKIIDSSVAAAAPTVTAQVPSAATAGETIHLSAQAGADGVPAVAYHWDFGDGTRRRRPQVVSLLHQSGRFCHPPNS